MSGRTTEHTIELDLRHRAIRSEDRWVVQRRQPDGRYDMVDAWDGNRRTLYRWMERHGVVPSREAERQLAGLPEYSGFRDRRA